MLRIILLLVVFPIVAACQTSPAVFISPLIADLTGRYVFPHEGLLIVWDSIEIENGSFTYTEWVHSPMDDPRFDGLSHAGEVDLDEQVIVLSFDEKAKGVWRYKVLKKGTRTFLYPIELGEKYINYKKIDHKRLRYKIEENH